MNIKIKQVILSDPQLSDSKLVQSFRATLACLGDDWYAEEIKQEDESEKKKKGTKRKRRRGSGSGNNNKKAKKNSKKKNCSKKECHLQFNPDFTSGTKEEINFCK